MSNFMPISPKSVTREGRGGVVLDSTPKTSSVWLEFVESHSLQFVSLIVYFLNMKRFFKQMYHTILLSDIINTLRLTGLFNYPCVFICTMYWDILTLLITMLPLVSFLTSHLLYSLYPYPSIINNLPSFPFSSLAFSYNVWPLSCSNCSLSVALSMMATLSHLTYLERLFLLFSH